MGEQTPQKDGLVAEIERLRRRIQEIESQRAAPEIPGTLGSDFLRRYLHASREAMTICDATRGDYPIVYANEAFEKLTGYSAAETIGQHEGFLSDKTDGIDGLRELFDLYREGQAGSTVVHCCRKDGGLFWCEVSVSPVSGPDGRAEHYVTIRQDVSERVELQQQRDRARRDLETYFRLSSDFLVTTDMDGTLLRVSKSMAASLDYRVDEMVGRSYLEFVHPGDQSNSLDELEALLQGRDVIGFEDRWRAGDGSYRWIEWNAFRDPELNIIHAIARDISHQGHIIEAIRASEERFSLLNRATRDGVYDWDLETNVVWRNDNLLRLAGEEATGEPNLDWWAERIHPEDVDAVLSNMEEFLASNRERWFAEYRFLNASGDYSIVEEQAYVLRGADGTPRRMLGAITDITMRRRAEEEAIRLAAFPNENPDPVLASGASGKIVYANRATGQFMLEHSCTLADLLPVDHEILVQQCLRFEGNRITVDRPACGRWLRWDYHGSEEANRVHLYANDITRMREQEESLRASEERYRRLVDAVPGAIMIHGENMLQFVNPAALDLLGASSADQLSGHSIDMILPEGTSFSSDDPPDRLRRLDGSLVEVEIVQTSYPSRSGEKTLWVAHDRTDRNRARRLQKALAELGAQLSGCGTAREAGQIAARSADELFGFDACFVGCFSPDNRMTETLLAVDTVDGERREIAESIGAIQQAGDLSLTSIEQGGILIRTSDETRKFYTSPFGNVERRSESILHVPMREGGRNCIGFVSIHSYTPNAYGEEDLGTLQILADYCAAAIVRTRAQDELRQSAQRYRRAITQAEAIAYERDNLTREFLYLGEGIQELTGYSPAELDCKTWDRMVEDITVLNLRESKPVPFAKLTEEQEITDWRAEYRIRTKSGETRWLVDSAAVVCDHTGRKIMSFGILQDVTGHKRMLEEVARRQREFETLVANARDVVARLDPDLRYLYINPIVETVTGRSPEEFIGRRGEKIDIPRPAAEAINEGVQRVFASRQEISFEFPFEKDGTTRYFETRAVPEFHPDGKTVESVLCIAREVTTQREAEIEQRRLERQIQHAQKLESLGVLAGGIAHDFNNILSGILGNAGLLLEETGHESPAHPVLKNIEMSAVRAAELTRQMLDYSGRRRSVIEAVDINEIVRETAGLLAVSINKKANLELDLSRAATVIRADASQVQQIIMNLITNASDSLGDESGNIHVRTETRDVSAEELHANRSGVTPEAGRYAVLEVSDTGAGMDKATLERIFDPFFSTKFSGRGLGLAVVLGIIRGHGGAIAVRSKPSEGTVFRVYLPSMAENIPLAPSRNDRRGDDGEKIDLKGKVLLVDDEESVRHVLQRTLSRREIDSIEAADGIAGLDAFRARKEEIALILLDLTMPRLGGREAFLGFREIDPDIPIVLMSGFSEKDAVASVDVESIDGFLAKPFRPNDVIATIARVVRSRRDAIGMDTRKQHR